MSLLIFQRLAEERIREAIRKGEFDNLPGKGKPLKLEDLSLVPEELRLAYKVLKNAGFVPPEVQLQKEIRNLEDLLETLGDEEVEKQYRVIKRLNFLIMQLNQFQRKSVLLEKEQYYYQKVAERVERLRAKEKKNAGRSIDWSSLSQKVTLTRYLSDSSLKKRS
ncbi:DUF1992 domain-containing protein [Thermosulfurimonas dismutans]|uniref:DnaJ homologue subfamily C member 28 conserved domain-containing protein n=1 Tax=Thermosulfurimonas dismutans TaxID=999894 RepID=A0A179D1U6_9BACT|nr:DUF1992 domain-containing protein [Thermosulfurimonas dismutans]OAQ19963.1 hypothetical protein TDIS_1962 [Thermosulfurimonas dismutans]